jgi:hypothetical protein
VFVSPSSPQEQIITRFSNTKYLQNKNKERQII